MKLIDIPLISIFWLLIPTFIMICTLQLLDIKIIKTSTISFLRMIAQLLLVGVYLEYIFKYDNFFLNFFYVVFMILIASISILNTSKLSFKRLYIPLFLVLFLSWFIVYVMYSFLVLKNINFFKAQYIIPISGIFLGDILGVQITLVKRFFADLQKNKESYFYLLSMGATRFEALKDFYKEAIQSALDPNLARMATIGLVVLPGVMTGQILAGTSPLIAIKYQVTIMIALFFTKILSLIFSVFVINSLCFDKFSRIRKHILKDIES